jgi:hypothetical protein
MAKRHANRRAWALCGLLFGTALIGSATQAEKLYPVDEGPRDPSFLAFRNQLIAAAKRRDQRFLLSHLDPQVLVSPLAVLSKNGYGRGIKDFKREYQLEDPKSRFWEDLISILSMGGSFKRGEAPYEGLAPAGREFIAPYVRSAWPVRRYPDTERYAAIIERDVPVRRRPDRKAPVVAVLSYDIVKTGEGNDYWLKITIPRGKQGYVETDEVGYAADTEAHFAKKHGKWVMTGLFETFTE